MDVPVELSRILITEFSEQQVIYLREKGGERTFPIGIGIAEALAIKRRLNGTPVQRPMTHDLLGNVIEAMGGRLERIVINDLRKLGSDDLYGTFIATLFIQRDDELIEVDSRPSDAIALGVANDTPVFVAEHVLDEATRGTATRKERIDLLRKRMEVLGGHIRKITAQLADKEFLADAGLEVVRHHRHVLKEMKTEYEAIESALKKYG